jgi:hypothetical protein
MKSTFLTFFFKKLNAALTRASGESHRVPSAPYFPVSLDLFLP